MSFFRREIRFGSVGRDVIAVKRALARAGYGDFYARGTRTPLFGPYAVQNLKHFQRDIGRPQSGVLGRLTFSKLYPFFDAYSRSLYAEPKDEALAKARMLHEVCQTFTGPYQWGGGHGPPLSELSVHQPLDCSSAVSLALYRVDLMPSTTAQVSGWFEGYGSADPGRYVSIHATWDHVWIEFTLPEGWSRFDTSPHGCGVRGPRVRTCPRDQTRFTHRHPRGM